jgi:hypothetical protein
LRRTATLFALRVVVQHQHHQPSAVARAGVLKHLLVAGRVAERCIGPASNHQVYPFRLAAEVIEQREFRLFDEYRLPVLVGRRKIVAAKLAPGSQR